MACARAALSWATWAPVAEICWLRAKIPDAIGAHGWFGGTGSPVGGRAPHCCPIAASCFCNEASFFLALLICLVSVVCACLDWLRLLRSAETCSL